MHLKEFLIEAKRATYASGDRLQQIKEPDQSTSIYHTNGDWSYHDNYFGGEPFGGREVVSYQQNIEWMMVYYGYVSTTNLKPDKVYSILQQALKNIPEEAPYRGPPHLFIKKFAYINKYRGDYKNFWGIEKIIYNRRQIYSARYCGGLVNR